MSNSSSKTSFRTDRQRVSGLGSAKEGTDHFWTQRVTAIALVPLTVLFIFTFAANLGSDYQTVLDSYQNPFNAIIAILFVLTAMTHLRLGMQVVIEDYVHGKAMHTALLLANTLLTWALALIGVFAIAKIAFAG